MSPEEMKKQIQLRAEALKAERALLSRQRAASQYDAYSYPVTLKRAVRIKGGGREAMREWFKSRDILTFVSNGEAGDVIWCDKWRTYYFKHDYHAIEFALTFGLI